MSAKGGGRRRGTFGGSRLSLTSLLFASAPKEKEKESLSRSANDLAEERKSARSLEEERMAEEAAEEEEDSAEELECALCARLLPAPTFPRLQTCPHRFCAACWRAYLETEIAESRVRLACADCPELLHPSDVYALLQDRPSLLAKWEAFALRRCLMSDPDTRFCPAPDCDFALIAAGCAACPELRCLAPGCGATFCYHCKGAWHPYETCDEARAARPPALIPADSSGGAGGSLRSQDLKACPRCRTYIVKMNDGSCNHMICPICGAEFCWLCLKEISDLHYLSPSGCTFWGKKPWSRKKKLLWQLGTLIGAPLGITLIAGLAVPAIIVGVPVLVGRKVHQRVKKSGRWHSGKRRAAVAGSVAGTFLVSPLLATMAVGVGVPIMLAYVYGVVPLSLCRNGNCGVSASSSGVRLDLDEEAPPTAVTDPAPSAAQSSTGGPETRRLLQPSAAAATTSIHSGTSSSRHLHVCTRGRRPSAESGATASLTANFEEASTRAIYADDKSLHTVAGSIGEDEASTRALAGSVLDAKSLCGLSFTSVSIRSDSRPPASNTALVTVETHPNPLHSRSERGSPAPLLEEELSGAEEEETTEAETSSARRPPVEAVLAADEEEGEFLLLSADAYHQLHPDGPPPPPPQPAASKAPSVSLLLENSPGELWQLFSDSVRGRSGSSRPGRLGSQRTTGGSISSLGEAAAGGSAQC